MIANFSSFMKNQNSHQDSCACDSVFVHGLDIFSAVAVCPTALQSPAPPPHLPGRCDTRGHDNGPIIGSELILNNTIWDPETSCARPRYN